MSDDNALTVQAAPSLPVKQVLEAIISASANPNVDVSKMRELLGLQKELMAMQAEQQFTEAFQRVSADMPRIGRDGTVEYKGKAAFRFATWQAIDAAVRPLLQREGFTLSFDTVPRQGDGGGIIVTGILSHVGGHRRTASIPVPLDTSGGKNQNQGYGSAMSYGRRYTAVALLNLTTEDDDDAQRGGMRFITEEQAEELRSLCKQAGRVEGQILDRLFSGTIHSFDEVEAGSYIIIRNTIEGIIAQQRKRAEAENGS